MDALNPTLDAPVAVQHGRVVPGVGWFDVDRLGIDQGPILAMIENHRSGLVWRTHAPQPARRARAAGRGVHGRMAGLDGKPGRSDAGWAPRVAAGRPAAAPRRLRRDGGAAHDHLRFWAMGREGEVVQELVRDFERENPGIRVAVQQIPWNAAHEKLLTAHVGRSTPDVAQLGNTWIAEFTALRAIAPLDRAHRGLAVPCGRTATSPASGTRTSMDGETYGVPWYVDTRVLFYRRDVLRARRLRLDARRWDGWRRAMEAVQRVAGPGRFAIFLPTNEYTPWIVFGLQAGSPLLKDDGTRGAFGDSAYRRAADFYLDLFRRGLAPAVPGASIANRYQEFERGTINMYISGPWDVGEFRRRHLPGAAVARGRTAPLPGPDGPAHGVSTAGGSSLVLFRASRHPDEAWRLVEFLSRPEQQLRFWPADRRPAGAASRPGATRPSRTTRHVRAFGQPARAGGVHAQGAGVGEDLAPAAVRRRGDGAAARAGRTRRWRRWTATWTASSRSAAGWWSASAGAAGGAP